MAPLAPKLHEKIFKNEKKHIGQRNIYKILKWLNLLIKAMVEKRKSFIQVEPAFPFPSLRRECCFSCCQENQRQQFLLHSQWQRLALAMRFLSPHHSGSQRRANALPRERQSGTGPSSRSSLVDVWPQGLVQSLKVGPVGYVTSPTTHHQLKERRWTQRRAVKENLDRTDSHEKV